MALFFRIIRGGDVGREFLLKPGLTVGRKRADILLEDRKVSVLHGVIEVREPDKLVLVDADSSNGILVNGNRVPKVTLEKHLELQLGNVVLQVFEREGAPGVTSFPPVTPPPRYWKDELTDWIKANSESLNAPTPATHVTAFASLIELEFVTGPQLRTRWQLGYGPRWFGSQSMEFPIWDRRAPAQAFRLEPDEQGLCRFVTEHPETVHINGESQREAILKINDEIKIFQATLKVRITPA
jgi:pSer/pThr/pTyr-binding forkhead associated (FHA) protein